MPREEDAETVFYEYADRHDWDSYRQAEALAAFAGEAVIDLVLDWINDAS